MADENWGKVKRIFAAAVEVAPEERGFFLDGACRDDADTRREVESLLFSHDDAEGFMENPAIGEVADFIGRASNVEPGACFGHYEIVEQIGAGGMGEVYLALDKKLERQVAVKILNEKYASDESNLRRFVREAKAASALNHPNILVIHEIGETEDAHYIVSEFIKGETLREICGRQTFETAQVLDVSIQIAGALGAAHEANIIHRDIKPENIMLRPDGYAKILDFGLAKLVERKSTGFESSAKRNETGKGLILGTPNYMSPEQSKGGQIDERTDIFSFGAVIYEMLTGKPPFAGDSAAETFANLISAAPLPISRLTGDLTGDLTDELSRIVFKMLRKNRDERYQTMHDILRDLKSLRESSLSDELKTNSRLPIEGNAAGILQATTSDSTRQTAETDFGFARRIKQRKPLAALALFIVCATVGFGFRHFAGITSNAVQIESIAVLPFENQNSDTEYLSDGLTESVINNLSELADLRVINRNSVFQYKNKSIDLAIAGRELNVQAILTGRFTKRGDDLDVNVELTDLRDNRQIWGRHYSRQIADISVLQQEIVRDAAESLRSKSTAAEKQNLAQRGTDDAEAFRLYLKGRYLWNKRTAGSLGEAAKFFSQAIDRDPTYALAYDGLAKSYTWGDLGYEIANSDRARMVEAAARRALEIDPSLGSPHATLAINAHGEWDWATAEKEYQQAIKLSPNDATAHHWYAEYLTTAGRFDEGFAEYERALILDPLSMPIATDLAIAYYYSRQTDRALERLKKLETLDPNFARTHVFLATVYEAKGMYAEAIEEFDQGYALYGATLQHGATLQRLARRKAAMKRALETSGAAGYWKETLKHLDIGNWFPTNVAKVYAALGAHDEAFANLEKDFAVREGGLLWLKVAPEFDNLRSDPRYADLVRRVGIPQ